MELNEIIKRNYHATVSRGACMEHYFAKFIFKLQIIYLK